MGPHLCNRLLNIMFNMLCHLSSVESFQNLSLYLTSWCCFLLVFTVRSYVFVLYFFFYIYVFHCFFLYSVLVCIHPFLWPFCSHFVKCLGVCFNIWCYVKFFVLLLLLLSVSWLTLGMLILLFEQWELILWGRGGAGIFLNLNHHMHQLRKKIKLPILFKSWFWSLFHPFKIGKIFSYGH